MIQNGDAIVNKHTHTPNTLGYDGYSYYMCKCGERVWKVKPHKRDDIWEEQHRTMAVMLDRLLAGEDVDGMFADYGYKRKRGK